MNGDEVEIEGGMGGGEEIFKCEQSMEDAPLGGGDGVPLAPQLPKWREVMAQDGISSSSNHHHPRNKRHMM